MKIALYKNLGSVCGPIILTASKYNEKSSDLLRVSEIMEVEFKDLPKPPKVMVAERNIAAAQKQVDAAQAKLKALQDEQYKLGK